MLFWVLLHFHRHNDCYKGLYTGESWLVVNDASVHDDEDVADIIRTGCVSFPFLCKQSVIFCLCVLVVCHVFLCLLRASVIFVVSPG